LQIPGLSKIVNTMTPATHPGLLGICLSGAGPTILALVSNEGAEKPAAEQATPQMEAVGEAIKALWKEDGIEVEWLALEVDDVGATLEEHK
jgi:homoserine kinase